MVKCVKHCSDQNTNVVTRPFLCVENMKALSRWVSEITVEKNKILKFIWKFLVEG